MEYATNINYLSQLSGGRLVTLGRYTVGQNSIIGKRKVTNHGPSKLTLDQMNATFNRKMSILSQVE